MSKGGGRGGKKGRVDFIKPSDPAFLRRLKEQIGYKEPADDLEAKREVLPLREAEDDLDPDDERPTVVVLRTGDLSQDDANKLFDAEAEKLKLEAGKDAKPIFKKPEKRKADAEEDPGADGSEKKKIESQSAKVSNKSLLSFDDEEDDDGS